MYNLKVTLSLDICQQQFFIYINFTARASYIWYFNFHTLIFLILKY